MRVSCHVPVHLTARQAVEHGFDELQHANFLFLNFLGDTLDTRTPLRFTAVASKGADLSVTADRVRDFVRLLKERDIVVDPTVAVFERMFKPVCDQPTCRQQCALITCYIDLAAALPEFAASLLGS